jgi:hypothetical protein
MVANEIAERFGFAPRASPQKLGVQTRRFVARARHIFRVTAAVLVDALGRQFLMVQLYRYVHVDFECHGVMLASPPSP